MPEQPRDLNHVYLEGSGTPTPYSPRPGRGATPRDRDRLTHATHLEQLLTLARQAAVAVPRDRALQVGDQGYYLEFELPTGDGDVLKRLEDRGKGVELAAIRKDASSGSTFATVVVPDAAADVFERKLQAYKGQDTKKGKPKNAPLMTNIEGIRHAALRSIFVGRVADLPNPQAVVWWEV